VPASAPTPTGAPPRTAAARPWRPGPASGPVLFARYAYPPNRLGLCGPDDSAELLASALANEDVELRQLARGFEGAYPYLRLIGEANRRPDPLERSVVEAYWIGNELTRRVPARSLHRDLSERFRARIAPRDWGWLEASLATGSRPHHAFHVLEIYPRAGLMRSGAVGPLLETMDRCRIRWGRVAGVIGEQLAVTSRRLELVDGRLQLGAERTEVVDGWRNDAGLLGGVAPGDDVALHWGWACDRLSRTQRASLQRWTSAALASANAAI